MKTKILLIYTGGTIGMAYDRLTNALIPVDFHHIDEQIPELKRLNLEIDCYSFEIPIDSSNISTEHWIEIATVIEDKYNSYDGFVILHGSDTMAFSASALSFMLENLGKPVVFTGSQLPIGQIRTDGKENLITAVEIAALKNEDGTPKVPEVCILFEDGLYRGNRTHKKNAEYFEAFDSPNYPPLAKVGIGINFNQSQILKYPDKAFQVHKELDPNVHVLHLYPGIQPQAVEAILKTTNLKALVLLTYGAGNATTDVWFLEMLNAAIEKGVIIFNVTQCEIGSVKQGLYETSSAFNRIGVIGGNDITFEAAITKLMVLLGCGFSREEIIDYLKVSLRGEFTL